MAAVGSESLGSGSLSTRKLQSKLDKLNPTLRLVIPDWLLRFRSACGTQFGDVFVWAMREPMPQDYEEFYDLFPQQYSTIGICYDEQIDPSTNTPRTDPLTAEIVYTARRRAFTVADHEAWFEKQRGKLLDLNNTVRDWLITNVDWEKDAELKRLIRGSPTTLGWGDPQCWWGGCKIYAWLANKGGVGTPEVQKSLVADWAAILAESHLSRLGKPRAITIFSDVSSSEVVIAKVQRVLENYESVASQVSQPPSVFIDVMLQLLSDEVPALSEWAKTEQIKVDLDENVYPSRSAWVDGVVTKLLRARLPAANAVFESARR